MSVRVPRRTRRAAIVAAATAAVAFSLRDVLQAGGRHRRERTTVAFDGMADRTGWGRSWHLVHYRRTFAVADGRGVLGLPAGLETTAPAQPTPVLLLDRSCGDCEIQLDFAIDNPSARPGLVFHATSPFDFSAVTVEGPRLVLAGYHRTGRDVIATGSVSAGAMSTDSRLWIAVRGPRVRAALGRGSRRPGWQLDAELPFGGTGTPGVVLVHPTDLRPATLRVRALHISAATAPAPTPPVTTYLLAGVPVQSADGTWSTRLRVGSGYPAHVRFEWSNDPSFSGHARDSGWQAADAPPYTATTNADTPGGDTMYWRARLRSTTSGAEVVTATQSITRHDPEHAVVLLAGSCIEFGGMPPTYGLTRMQAAAPAPPAAMVFQGDMGYANNKYHSCYLAEPDYFADRFTRFLADPRFTHLRRTVPVGFTMDDHDYGPRNNADRTTMKPWAFHLWNQMHADPTPSGYFDFRIGDTHCLTLDGRRYADPIGSPNRPAKTKLGRQQFSWMQSILESSDAKLFVIFSADTFASRYLRPGSTLIPDCFISGWPDDYQRAMALFTRVQATGRRVVILSGDAHSLRIHHHPPVGGRPGVDAPIVEFVCSGLRPRRWFGAATGDPSLDRSRNVLGKAGGGMIMIDGRAAPTRTIVLRAISGERDGPADLFPPLTLPFAPAPYGTT